MILWTSRHLITAALLLALTTPAAAVDAAAGTLTDYLARMNAARLPPKFYDHPSMAR
jgi:hypothetical protein